jgi:hypothetical protein
MIVKVKGGEALVELTKPEQKKLGDCTGLVSALATHGCFPSAAVAVKALKQLQEDLERQGMPAVESPY